MHLEQVVPHFIKKDEWPPQSPDLSPMDYTMWDSLSVKVYKGRTQKFTENELERKFRTGEKEGENSGKVGENYSGRSQKVNRVIQKET